MNLAIHVLHNCDIITTAQMVHDPDIGHRVSGSCTFVVMVFILPPLQTFSILWLLYKLGTKRQQF